jgi:hypothetical protein
LESIVRKLSGTPTTRKSMSRASEVRKLKGALRKLRNLRNVPIVGSGKRLRKRIRDPTKNKSCKYAIGGSKRRRLAIRKIKKYMEAGAKRNKKIRKSTKRTKSIVRREGYYRKTPSGRKVYIKPKVISSRGLSKLQRKAFTRTKKKKCPKGKVLRPGYYKDTYKGRKYKKAKCMDPSKVKKFKKDIMPSVKTILPFKLTKGILSSYGYSTTLKPFKRQKKLMKLARDINDRNYLVRYLNGLRIFNKNRPKLYNVFNKDMQFVQSIRPNVFKPFNLPVGKRTSYSSVTNIPTKKGTSYVPYAHRKGISSKLTTKNIHSAKF